MTYGPGPVVKPEWKLAELALKVLENAPTARRNTIVMESPVKIADDPLFGPAKDTQDQNMGDASSDVTLVGDTILTPDSEADENQKESVGGDHVSNHSKADSMDLQDNEGDETKPVPPSREPPPVPPRPKDGPDPEAKLKKIAEDAAKQQDVHEVINKVLYQTQCAIRPDRIDQKGNQLNKIREYVLSSLVRCSTNTKASMFYLDMTQNYPDKTLENKEEEDNTLYVHLETRPQNVYGALDILFGLNSVDGANGSKVDRYATIQHLPPMLQFFFQRQYFDKATKSSSTIKHHVKLDETIYMDRYMTPSPKLEELRAESRNLTRQLTTFELERTKLSATQCGWTGPDVLDRTWQYIDNLGEELNDIMAVQEDIQKAAEKLRKQLETVEQQIQALESQRSALPFSEFDTDDNCYKLFAVFVHSGVASSTGGGGHYWIYLRDFEKQIWRKYNDNDVSIVTNEKEIFEPAERREGQTTYCAPYYVVYVRDKDKADMVDPLYRIQETKPEPIEELDDVEMTDGEQLVDRESDWQEIYTS
jgi:ubiquitin carboxyl-terminal hydrolase 25/28